MKKTTVFTTMLIAALLSACGKSDTTDTASTTSITSTTSTTESTPIYEEVEELLPEEYGILYRKAVSFRFDDKGNFNVDDETVEAIKALGVSSEMHYPVVVNGVLVYIDDNGCLYKASTEDCLMIKQGKFLTPSAHVQIEEGCKIVERSTNWAVTYTEETGLLEFWQFGEVIEAYQLPANSVYAGKSAFAGYIFRYGNDVYAAGYARTDVDDPVCIAHGVEFVIMADYRLGSDPWSQPLFLMVDGTIQAYVTWEGNGEPDDPSHLTNVVLDGVEGGYR